MLGLTSLQAARQRIRRSGPKTQAMGIALGTYYRCGYQLFMPHAIPPPEETAMDRNSLRRQRLRQYCPFTAAMAAADYTHSGSPHDLYR